MMPIYWQKTLVVVALVAFFAIDVRAQDKIAVGKSSFEFIPDSKKPKQTLKVWSNRPEGVRSDSPIVFVMHGVKRNGEGYRDNWAGHSNEGKFLLIVPEFPEEQYPSEQYSQGNITRGGKSTDPSEWTFTIVEKLFDHVKLMTGNKSEKYYLYGHSAGGQFVHRFVMFMPEARYARAIAANPGYYTFPSKAASYPYGLNGTHIKDKLSPKVYARDFVVLLGEADTIRDDPNFRKTPEADAQGLTRFERGNKYFNTAKEMAQKEKAKFNWKLVTVPGVGHSDGKMSQSAAKVLLEK